MAGIGKGKKTDGLKESIKTDISKGEQRDAIKRLEDAVDIVSNSCTIVFFHLFFEILKRSKGAKIRNRCNQVPHLTQNTNRKVTNSQLDTTDESQEVSPFTAGDHKARINGRRVQRHNKHKTEKT